MTFYAAASGKVALLEWLISEGCAWDKEVCDAAAMIMLE